jgi:hypothetical protein
MDKDMVLNRNVDVSSVASLLTSASSFFLKTCALSRVHTVPLYASWQGQMALPELV